MLVNDLDIVYGQIDSSTPLEFPECSCPLVSIIIPVHNQWKHTYACLTSILRHSTSCAYEIVIADDVSTDETMSIDKLIFGVRVVRNSINLGFLRNCNQAAKQSKGKYILFLNNDTNVQPGWLESLTVIMDADPLIGIAGSKLVYPDGRLQEAGGIIWSNASGRNYGRLDDATRPEYNYVKEVDYISGASIMVRRDFWEEVGGFDGRFAPAYYEDTDLAFSARQYGYKVVFQPESVVVHFEGISHGTDLTSGVKSYQVRNKNLFYEKWQHVLETEQFKRDQHLFWARDRSRLKTTVLFVDYQHPNDEGSAASEFNFLYLQRLLATGLNVKYLGVNLTSAGHFSSILNQLGIETFNGPWLKANGEAWLEPNGQYFDYVFYNQPVNNSPFVDFLINTMSAESIYQIPDLQKSKLSEICISEGSKQLTGYEVYEQLSKELLLKSNVILTFSNNLKEAIAQLAPSKIVETTPVYLPDNLSNLNVGLLNEQIVRIFSPKINSHDKYPLNEEQNHMPNPLFTGGENAVPLKPCKTIAFHLPQYHPIRENDEWWGKGFTEWTNVTKAQPQFPGHYQPHLPSDLGFYDLRLPDVRKAQAELAREHGIHGFCYYHYWFGGKLLLEKPLHDMLESREPDFPFCLCWANEPWTRAWDGRSGHVLAEQHYGEEDDRKHIQYLTKFFQDPRYIRVKNKPLLLIYRANHMPDPFKAAKVMRDEARKLGIGELYLCRVESFPNEHTDPHLIGFDASVEFQPDWTNLGDKDPNPIFGDHVVRDYQKMADRMMAKVKPPYKRFPCVTPAWDNASRRKTNATIFVNSTPAAYENWLCHAISKCETDNPDDRIVFINAWNEWGEGCHLEPDQVHGRAYLEATRNAITTTNSSDKFAVNPSLDPIVFQKLRHTENRVERERLIAEKDAILAERDRAVAEQGESMQQIAQMERRIQELQNSLSWQVTKPLRIAYDLFRGINKK